MNASRVAVIDIGKTNAKLVVFDLQAGREIAARTTPNRVIDTPPYPHFDTEALFAFLKSALAELHRAYSFEAISITAHGATIAVLDEQANSPCRCWITNMSARKRRPMPIAPCARPLPRPARRRCPAG